MKKAVPITEKQNVVVAWFLWCDECGAKFKAKRRDAKKCSGACRQRHSRRALKLEKSKEA